MSDERPVEKLGPPPVEPMAPAAWTRVERGLWDKLDAAPLEAPRYTRARWQWIAGPMVAVAAVIAIVLAVRGDSAPTLANEEPSRVVAGETPTSISYGDAHLTVAPHAAIVLRNEQGSPATVIDRGETTFVVAPRGTRPPFIVRAADVVVRVVGTEFRVARYDERVTVAVESGIVDVQFRARMHRLTAGQHWSSESPDITAHAEPVAPPVAPPTPPPPPPKPAPVDERALFERLSALEARDPARALTGYLDLSRGSSAWSSVALFAAGRLAADRQDKRARSFLELYLRRFPTGANAEDARDLLQRLPGEK